LFIAILALLNKKKLMGKYANGLFANIVSWMSVVFIVVMASLLVVMTFFPGIV
jgi:Mn2+/Fe2+ NRAMP family transporter